MPRILVEKRGGVATITFNRPEVNNSFDPEMILEAQAAEKEFIEDNDLRVLILTGAGERAFCTGMDLKAAAARISTGQSAAQGLPAGGMIPSVQTWKPIIAAINGYCLAGGLNLSLRCDIRICSDNARFGMLEVKRSIVSPVEPLARTIPFGPAMYILLTGDMVDAEEALRINLVTRVVPLPELMPAALRIAEMIEENGPLAVQAIKKIALTGRNLPIEYAQRFASEAGAIVSRSEDAKEGPRAFAEKRKPAYKGR